MINVLTIYLFFAAITEDAGTWSENNDDVVSMETMSSNPTPVPGTILDSLDNSKNKFLNEFVVH